MTSITATVSYPYIPLTKLELVEKLLNEKHITFKEGLLLMEKENGVQQITPYPIQPYQPLPNPWVVDGGTGGANLPRTLTTSVGNDEIRDAFQ